MCPRPRGLSAGWEGMGAGHRPTLWQVPEVCNLLRHLKNVTRNVSLEGNCIPNGDYGRGREGGEPRGNQRRLWALQGGN